MIYLRNRHESNISKNKDLLVYSLSSISTLSLFYRVSVFENNNVYSYGVLSIFLICILLIYLNNNNIKDYLIINFVVIAVSLGYMLLPLIVCALYILIDRFYIHIEEFLHFESYKSDD